MNSREEMRFKRLWGAISLALILAIAIATVACTDSLDGAEPESGVTEVEVDDNRFSPRAIEVSVGTEVTWNWVGERAHNVVGEDFDSGTQESGTFTHRFESSGTYDYSCTVHPGMTGRVVVVDKEGNASEP